MFQRYKNIIMWVLYAAMFLLVMLFQTAVFGRTRFFGVKLDLIPVVLVCISAFVGHESGGLFCLLAALVWHLSGAEDGPLAIITMTACGIASGFVCSQFSRRFFPAMGMCAAALLFHESARFLLKYYLGSAEGALVLWVLKILLLSLLAWPGGYLLAKAIRKVGE